MKTNLQTSFATLFRRYRAKISFLFLFLSTFFVIEMQAKELFKAPTANRVIEPILIIPNGLVEEQTGVLSCIKYYGRYGYRGRLCHDGRKYNG
jgi:hypothetical protein